MFPIGDDDSAERSVPIVTYALIALNVLFFFVELSGGEPFIERWSVVPRRLTQNPGADFITVFTSMFMHGGWLHLGGNMLFLWIFGNNVEDLLGRLRYLLLYLGSGVAAALVQALSSPQSHVPMLGASGAVAGMLGAYLMTYPRANVHCLVWIVIFFWIVTVPAWILLGLWFAMQLLSGLAVGPNSPGVAFWAHVGGFGTGILL